MSSHAKEITGYKDNIPKLLFLASGKIAKDFNESKAVVSRARLEFDTEGKTFIFDFTSTNENYIATNLKVLNEDGDSILGIDSFQDIMGPPINDTIN
jgi:hypothetical protein